MTSISPGSTTVGDLVDAALRESGKLGVGQTALAEDATAAWTRCQWMLEEWQRKRWLVYQLVTYLTTATGVNPITIGPGGAINTGTNSVRPERLESAFLRQTSLPAPNQVDYPLELIQSMEDWSRIPLKNLVAFSKYIFLDPGWPLGNIYTYPVAQASVYSIGVVVKQQLQAQFLTLSDLIALPYEYYNAIVLNLAVRMRSYYAIPTFNGDPLPMLAKDSLNAIRGANAAVSRLQMPRDIGSRGRYNIYSDRNY